MTNQKQDEIFHAIHRAYGSMTHPDYSFVQKNISKAPYRNLISTISKFFNVKDTTDLNDDVSLCLRLSKNAKNWSLELSFVGPYAVILKVDDGGKPQLVTHHTTLDDELMIVELLADNSIEFLTKEILELPCPIKLFVAEKDETHIYQALFTDIGMLPWK